MNNPNIYICKTNSSYPSPDYLFAPDEAFPEYPFSDVSSVQNLLYRQMRQALYDLGYDKEHFGYKEWNPFSCLVSKGDTVLIKPNWVSHHNNNPEADEECLVTNTAIVRFVIDYCVIALQGTGSIIVGDAPIQGADFHQILTKYHINELKKYYEKNNVELCVNDLRDRDNAVYIDMSEHSLFSYIHDNQQYHVMDYLEEKTQEYHHDKQQIYCINKTVLNADVIFNLPKPKCHKLAGFTGALKNMVGTVADKATLPHERIGSPEKQGDSSNKPSLTAATVHSVRHRAEIAFEEGKQRKGYFFKKTDSLIRKTHSLFSKDLFLFGGWYGNDTIWRTIHDLNYIIRHYDKNGNYHDKVQRKMFIVADMLIAGENEGPLSPTPKKVGIIILSDDPVAADAAIVQIMGFDYMKIPTTSNIRDMERILQCKVLSNRSSWNEVRVRDISTDSPFVAQSGWKGHIERNQKIL